LIAKPCLYLLDDESGNRQGANLIHDFASNNFSDTADENYKWVITGTTRSYEYSALKPSDGIAKKIVNLKNGSASSLAYTDSVSLAAGDYRFVDVPEITAAVAFFQGGFDETPKGYEEVYKWIEDNGYEIDGPGRSIGRHGPWDREDASEYVTEIQVPIKKK